MTENVRESVRMADKIKGLKREGKRRKETGEPESK